MDIVTILAIFAGVSYYIYKSRQNNNHKSYDEYLSKKREALSTEKYLKFLDTQEAEIKSEIRIGKSRLRINKEYQPNSLLLNALEMIETERNKFNN